MVRLKSVEILFVDEEGNENFKEFNVGDEEVVGDTLHTKWRVDRIEGLKVKVDTVKEEAVKLLNAVINESIVRFNIERENEEVISKKGLWNEISQFLNNNNLRNARMRGNGGR